jgi:thiamine-phosphate pyrophosphorylase
MKREIGRLHVITDTILQHRFDAVQLAIMAARGGADVVQYRHKQPMSTQQRMETIKAMLHCGARVIVNDHVDIAHCAHGAHVGAHDLPCHAARALLADDKILGSTVNTMAMAYQALHWPVDYVGVGPVFPTRSKERTAPTLGLDGLYAIASLLPYPVIAIGGIGPEQIADVRSAGAYGVAILSYVVCADDPERATRACRKAMDR